ncbi:hypothetical protein BDR26DRAFT_858463, partial [Obelidium mucronatum]
FLLHSFYFLPHFIPLFAFAYRRRRCLFLLPFHSTSFLISYPSLHSHTAAGGVYSCSIPSTSFLISYHSLHSHTAAGGVYSCSIPFYFLPHFIPHFAFAYRRRRCLSSHSIPSTSFLISYRSSQSHTAAGGVYSYSIPSTSFLISYHSLHSHTAAGGVYSCSIPSASFLISYHSLHSHTAAGGVYSYSHSILLPSSFHTTL